MKTAIFGNKYQRDTLESVGVLLQMLKSEHVDLALERSFATYLASQIGNLPSFATFEAGEALDADLALSIGGDGTFLRTAHAVARQGLPIMGVNAGHLGYLTTAGVNDAAAVVQGLVDGSYDVESRTMLQVELPSGEQPVALNEIAILRQDTSSMIEVSVDIDDTSLTTYRGDGLLVCTPTGSTAYNLSVGGPILQPQSQCFVLSPISPHSLTMRPVVINDLSNLSITAHTRASLFQVSVDGQTYELPNGTTFHITKAPFVTKVAMLKGHRFASVLRNKLMWGLDSRS